MTMIKGDLEKIAEGPAEIIGGNYKLIAEGLNYLIVKPAYFVGREVKRAFSEWYNLMFRQV